MCTYNHERYIAEAIEGVLKQKTNFKFRLFIGEDASTDNTRKIVLEYASKFPEIIFPVLHDVNVGAMENTKILYSKCTSKYVALCDGDDYWTDQNKLSWQVEFLEKNPSFAVVGHGIKKIDNNSNPIGDFIVSGEFGQVDIVRNYPISTLSAVFRRSLLDEEYSRIAINIYNGDYFLFLYLLKNGSKGYIIPEFMGVHRSHDGGAWSAKGSMFAAQKYMDSTDIFLANDWILQDDTKKEIIKKRKELIRDYTTYERISLFLLLQGKINFFAFIKFYIDKFKRVVKKIIK